MASAIVFAPGQNVAARMSRFWAMPLPAFRDASFDLVLCNSVLHHLARPATLLAEIARVAKPAGAILVRDYAGPRG